MWSGVSGAARIVGGKIGTRKPGSSQNFGIGMEHASIRELAGVPKAPPRSSINNWNADKVEHGAAHRRGLLRGPLALQSRRARTKILATSRNFGSGGQQSTAGSLMTLTGAETADVLLGITASTHRVGRCRFMNDLQPASPRIEGVPNPKKLSTECEES